MNKLQLLLAELKRGLEALYGEHLKGVYLFGSHARGEADDESDVDVLVVLDAFDHYVAEVDRTGALGSQLSLKYVASISTVFIRASDWARRYTPFLANVREDAIPA